MRRAQVGCGRSDAGCKRWCLPLCACVRVRLGRIYCPRFRGMMSRRLTHSTHDLWIWNGLWVVFSNWGMNPFPAAPVCGDSHRPAPGRPASRTIASSETPSREMPPSCLPVQCVRRRRGPAVLVHVA
eukprot:2446077-Prymnesium_polylepis.2